MWVYLLLSIMILFSMMLTGLLLLYKRLAFDHKGELTAKVHKLISNHQIDKAIKLCNQERLKYGGSFSCLLPAILKSMLTRANHSVEEIAFNAQAGFYRIQAMKKLFMPTRSQYLVPLLIYMIFATATAIIQPTVITFVLIWIYTIVLLHQQSQLRSISYYLDGTWNQVFQIFHVLIIRKGWDSRKEPQFNFIHELKF